MKAEYIPDVAGKWHKPVRVINDKAVYDRETLVIKEVGTGCGLAYVFGTHKLYEIFRKEPDRKEECIKVFEEAVAMMRNSSNMSAIIATIGDAYAKGGVGPEMDFLINDLKFERVSDFINMYHHRSYHQYVLIRKLF